MVKVDTSKVASGTDLASFCFAMDASYTYGGKELVARLCTNIGFSASAYGDTTAPNGATSIWYVSNDAKSWTAVTAGADNPYVEIGAKRGILYVYIPTTSFYVCQGETQLKGGDKVTTEPTLTYAQALEIIGGDGFTSLCDFSAWFGSDNVSQGMTLSEVSLVGDARKVFANESITLTDDLSYNIYANLPAGATGAKMTFTFVGNTVEVEGVPQSNGTVKFTLKNILPQQMGETITAIWSATVDGQLVTDTRETTIEAYARYLIGRADYDTWHDMAKALLHYGAASQSYIAVDGETIALVNKDVGPVCFPMAPSDIPFIYENGDTAVWKSVGLRLESAIKLKIGLAAPEGVTHVQYTLEGKTSVVEIVKDAAGKTCVYIPVYAHQFMDEITVAFYKDGAVTDDVTLKISASWYLANKDTAGNAKLEALIAALANYATEARNQKDNDNPTSTTIPSA